jgi:predicted nucleic acid-binding protein
MANSHPSGLSRLAFDTNPFLLLVTHKCLESKNARERVRILTDIRGQSDNLPPERFADLWYVFEHAARRIITQHVVVEALKFSRTGWLRDHKDDVRESAIALVTEFGVEDLSCPILTLHASKDHRPALIALGVTDAGLLYTAEQQKAALITDDGPLLHYAYARNVPAFPINQVHNLITCPW